MGAAFVLLLSVLVYYAIETLLEIPYINQLNENLDCTDNEQAR